jgi:hypothetical protein
VGITGHGGGNSSRAYGWDFADANDNNYLQYVGDISRREDQDNEAEGYDTLSHGYPVTLHPTILQCAKRLRDHCHRPFAQSSQKSLQQAYHSLVLATFTIKTNKRHFPL